MYKAATNLVEAQKVMLSAKAPDPDQLGSDAWACGGKRPMPVRVAIWHGEGDNIINRDNGELVLRQFIALNDLADDGRRNGSVANKAATESAQAKEGYAYTRTRYEARGRPLIEYYKVEKMGHAWSGGKDDLLFSDAKGPDASLLIWNFFSQFSR